MKQPNGDQRYRDIYIVVRRHAQDQAGLFNAGFNKYIRVEFDPLDPLAVEAAPRTFSREPSRSITATSVPMSDRSFAIWLPILPHPIIIVCIYPSSFISMKLPVMIYIEPFCSLFILVSLYKTADTMVIIYDLVKVFFFNGTIRFIISAFTGRVKSPEPFKIATRL